MSYPKCIIIFGTRPEIIKLSSIINLCFQQGNLDVRFIHTGQHYSYELDHIFFRDLNLPGPTYNLKIGSCPQGEQIGKMLMGIEKILLVEKPDVVIVLGDPNSAFAGALASAKHHIPVCHIEAGRRSGNRKMPEELNRLMIDQISDHLFTPNLYTKDNLLREGIPDDRITVSGDPIVDVVLDNKELAKEKSTILSDLNLTAGNYFLVTLHRTENVDDKTRLENLLQTLKKLSEIYHYPVIFPVHPRTRKMIEAYGLSTEGLSLIESLGYLDFLRLENEAAVMLTDSGSIQEEACILHVPCVTLRNDTERQETVLIGANILAGIEMESIIAATEKMLHSNKQWPNPFGFIGTGERIIEEIIHRYQKEL